MKIEGLDWVKGARGKLLWLSVSRDGVKVEGVFVVGRRCGA